MPNRKAPTPAPTEAVKPPPPPAPPRKRNADYIEPVGAFGFWENGSTHHEVHLNPSTAKHPIPFHVLLHGRGYVPVSVLVFADSGQHALDRVLKSIKECVKMDHGTYDHSAHVRGQKILDELEAGEIVAHVRPFDTKKIAAEVIWAGNGGCI